MRDSDAGSYVCTVSSGSLSVMSNTATLTVYGETFGLLINVITGLVQVFLILYDNHWMLTYQKREIQDWNLLLLYVGRVVWVDQRIPGREVLIIVVGLLLVMTTQHHTLQIQHWLLDSTCTGVE